MELNKEYNIDTHPLELLDAGTIIKILSGNNENSDGINDLLVITEPNGVWDDTEQIIGVSIKDGEFYISNNGISTYEIIRFKK